MYIVIVTSDVRDYYLNPGSDGIRFEVEKLETALEQVKTFTELDFFVTVAKVDEVNFDKNLFE